MATRQFMCLLSVFVVAAAGCTRNTNAPATITGTVKYKDQLVTGGNVSFVPDSGPTYPAAINPDGTYSMRDVPDGSFTVTVETESLNPNRSKMPVYGGARGEQMAKNNAAVKDGRQPGPGGRSPGPPGADAHQGAGSYVKIPPKYADAKTSTLKKTVTKGKNTIPLDLTD